MWLCLKDGNYGHVFHIVIKWDVIEIETLKPEWHCYEVLEVLFWQIEACVLMLMHSMDGLQAYQCKYLMPDHFSHLFFLDSLSLCRRCDMGNLINTQVSWILFLKTLVLKWKINKITSLIPGVEKGFVGEAKMPSFISSLLRFCFPKECDVSHVVTPMVTWNVSLFASRMKNHVERVC